MQIRAALDRAGYTQEPATPDALVDCFLDYAAAGYWRDLDLDDAREQIDSGEITLADMIRSLGR